MKTPVRFIAASAAASTMLTVSGVSGVASKT
jgi:hypothetical protein